MIEIFENKINITITEDNIKSWEEFLSEYSEISEFEGFQVVEIEFNSFDRDKCTIWNKVTLIHLDSGNFYQCTLPYNDGVEVYTGIKTFYKVIKIEEVVTIYE